MGFGVRKEESPVALVSGSSEFDHLVLRGKVAPPALISALLPYGNSGEVGICQTCTTRVARP